MHLYKGFYFCSFYMISPIPFDARANILLDFFFLRRVEVALLVEPLCDLSNALLDGVLVRLDGDLGVGRLLVGGGDAGEVLDLAGPGLLVQALGVALLGDLDGDVDEDLDKGNGLVVAALGRGLGVQLAGEVAVGAVRGNEGGDGDGGGVGEELGYLADAADVLVAVLLGEAQVLVEAEADVVAVEAVGRHAEVQQVLLEGRGHGRLARGREARQPDGQAALLAERVALLAREGGVPGDVAAFARRDVIVSLFFLPLFSFYLFFSPLFFFT